MSRLFDLLESLGEKQKSLEKQLTELRSFARHVEQFLEQRASGGATAPSETFRIPRSDSERTTVPQGHVPGTSSSSTRPPSYLQVPRPPPVPVPPVPQESASPVEPSRVSTTHISTVRSEVRTGAIRIDITNPEQSFLSVETPQSYEIKKQRECGI